MKDAPKQFPLDALRLSDLAAALDGWHYETLRTYAVDENLIPTKKHGGRHYVSREVAGRIIRREPGHGNLKSLLESATQTELNHA